MTLTTEETDAARLDPQRIQMRVTGIIGGPVAPATLTQLWTVTQGHRVFLDALVRVGLGLEVLAVRDGLWRWRESFRDAPDSLTQVIESHADELDSSRLDALERLLRPLTEPHAAVTRLRHRSMLPAAAHLTRRETDVLALLCDGLTAQAIAHRLELSRRTVTKHLERLYRKLGTSDRLTTVLRAQRLRIVASPHDDRHVCGFPTSPGFGSPVEARSKVT